MKKIILKPAKHFENIKEIIYNSAKEYGEKAAYIIKHKNNEYENKSYKEFLDDINSFGAGLYALGLKGKRVAVMGRNRYEWAVSHLANVMGGIVSVPLDKDLQSNELEDSLNRSGAEALVFDEKLEKKVDVVKDKTGVKHFICMKDGFGMSFNDVLKLGRENEDLKKEYINCTIDADALSILLFTSGTTDKSKAVMLCQRGIAQNVYDMQLVEDIRSEDVNIAFLPFHHIFGSTGFLVMIACGVTTVFADGLRYVKKNLKEYKVSLFIGVPRILDSMYKNIEKEVKKQGKEKLIAVAKAVSNFLLKCGVDMRRVIFKSVIEQLGAMRLIISGGAPLDMQTARNFRELGIELVQGYGLTETSPVIAAESWEFMRENSVGKPLKSVEVRIDNKDENGIGEIMVKGPNVMLGYYENDDATNAVMKDGWFATGDLGYLDKDGYLFITGREKNMIVLKNGKKVFPEELETLINRIEGVKESFVYGIDEDGLGCEKVLCKVVYDAEEVSGSFDEIYEKYWNKIKETNKTLPMYKYIKGMILTDEPLIKTTTNKVRRKEEMAVILSDKK